ncbi:hypothetical protein GQ44DRAFT_707409 [Phaeosphaeriaceae sp. PMI808]|nr:hypothetical protein GQ44DRAFT_707409 [Phaeosphaeriaceae sp. PMI808]
MQLTNFLLTAAAVATTASAIPTPPAKGHYFNVITAHYGSPIQDYPFQAAHNSLMVHASSQNATCDKDPSNRATFYIEDEVLYLYARSATPQTVFVDRSWMGNGLVGYVTGAQPIGAKQETKGWAISENKELQFKGQGLQACPGGIDGSWSIWLQGSEEPGWNKNCEKIGNWVRLHEEPIGCFYTAE